MSGHPTNSRKEPIRDLSATHPHLKEFFEFLPKANKESDRGLVLISISYIDLIMQKILLSYFIEGRIGLELVEGFNAPLGSLSTRSSAAYALGLISEDEYKECSRLRKIRNKFAHEIHVSFADSQIIDFCRSLTMSAKDYSDVEVGARGQFATSSVSLILNLTNRPIHVSRQRSVARNWEI